MQCAAISLANGGGCSYAVQPEVGKIGNNSSSFVLPVAERKDGVASFFKKQVIKEEAKPEACSQSQSDAAKTEVSADKKGRDRKVHSPPGDNVKSDPGSPHKRASVKVEGLDDGIGDDSNAPNKKRKTTNATRLKVEVDASDEEDVKVIPNPGPPKRQTRSSKSAGNTATKKPDASPKKVSQPIPLGRVGPKLISETPVPFRQGQASLDSFLK